MRFASLALTLTLTPIACTAQSEPSAPAGAEAPEESAPAPEARAPEPVKSDAELAEGDPAPAVTLTLHDGTRFDLADRTDTVFVYFYPKDDTPGCTVEAQGLRDSYDELRAAGVTVVGVSLQDAASHQSFIDKHSLPFALAVDDGSVASAFDVPVRGEYASRHSFLMKGGEVVKVWRSVSPAGHAAEVLEAVKSLGS